MQGLHTNITTQQRVGMKQQEYMRVLVLVLGKRYYVDVLFLLGLVLRCPKGRRDFPAYTTKEGQRRPPCAEGNQHRKMGKAHGELTVYLRRRPLCANVPVGRTDRMADNGVRLQGEMKKLRKVAFLLDLKQ